MMDEEEEFPDETSKVLNTINLKFASVKDPTYYYYKRWLWIIFPWACMKSSKKYDYSRIIAKCFSSNIRYLSVAEDRLLTNCSSSLTRFCQDCPRDQRKEADDQSSSS